METKKQDNEPKWEEVVKNEIQNELPNVFVQDAESEILNLVQEQRIQAFKEGRNMERAIIEQSTPKDKPPTN